MTQPSDSILIVDFGSQVTQLIARRVREAGVYSEIAPFNTAAEAFERMAPKGIILSGSPASVLEENGLVTGEDLVSAITEYTFEDSIFGKVSWDDYNNTVGPVYIREVQKLDDGNLYNVPIATIEDVDQWLGKDPDEALAQPTYSQTFQG